MNSPQIAYIGYLPDGENYIYLYAQIRAEKPPGEEMVLIKKKDYDELLKAMGKGQN